jgi:hypothetical protein
MPRVKTAAPESPKVNVSVEMPPGEGAPEEKPREKFDFWGYLAALSPQDWKRHVVYLYRIKPVVGMSTKEKYLDVIGQAFTIEDIKNRFGGEEFRAMLIRDGKALHTEIFSIEAAPKYDSRELPSNGARSEGINQQLLDKLLAERNAQSNLEGDALGRALDIVTTAYEKAVEKTGGNQPANGGTDMLTMIRVMKELGMIQQPKSLLQEVLELVTGLKAIGIDVGHFIGGGGGGGLGSLKDQIGMLKDLHEMIGGGGPRGWAESLIDKAPELLEHGVAALGKVADIQKQSAAQLETKARTAVQIAEIQQGRGRVPAASPAATAEDLAAQTGTVPIPQNPSGNSRLNVVPVSTTAAPTITIAPGSPQQEGETLMNFLKNKVVEMIGNPERTADDVLAFVEDFYPPVAQYLANLDPEKLRQFFAEDPILAKAMALERWPEWYKEACESLYEMVAEPAAKPN